MFLENNNFCYKPANVTSRVGKQIFYCKMILYQWTIIPMAIYHYRSWSLNMIRKDDRTKKPSKDLINLKFWVFKVAASLKSLDWSKFWKFNGIQDSQDSQVLSKLQRLEIQSLFELPRSINIELCSKWFDISRYRIAPELKFKQPSLLSTTLATKSSI